ncbi:Mur ligase family protein [Candidatus Nanosynsacchari sp. TM7_ANC_38.39_G1_1]|uniref:Mur ligase family protein n=1 Tax=Candidatus Nanosynsacchari sp. TM7_ANC_38.39_G1_1 TaxID=1986206 RepID=UPI00101D01DB|nr:Mur ligase family protein [Candidatus Nanosynsacchari sp. TM7_ANC_38.39_G1_1]
MSRQRLSTMIGKGVKKMARLRGGGSALPGLVIENIDPNFMQRTLSQLPHGVVVISGTNGKTTTTKIVVELLESIGLKVFTNRTGSNFSRGVIAALLDAVDIHGKLHADIAVLELDEAWAVKFVEKVPPRFSLLLNVMRDQLDRFGEIDTTAKMLEKIAMATTEAVVMNRDDQRIFAIHKQIAAKPVFFGATTELLELMPTDDHLKSGGGKANSKVHADVLLTKIDSQQATFKINDTPSTVKTQLTGVYNLLNAAAALTLVRCISDSHTEQFLTALQTIQPAFGRGETIMIDGKPIELILVKNPSGFRLALLSFAKKSAARMIAINDNYADGRDMSWLWDVDFSMLKSVAMVSGVRAYGMALRLQYDDVKMKHVEQRLDKALDIFLAENKDMPKQIFCSYTAMLTLRTLLSKKTKVEKIR